VPVSRWLDEGVGRQHVERRRYGRIQLDDTVRARLGDFDVQILELSVTGFLVAHQGRIVPGETLPLVLPWNGQTIAASCTVVRSTIFRLAKKAGEKSVYRSGLEIARFEGDSFEQLRQLIGERIIRALDEQKANARGIPPLAAYLYQPGKGSLYRKVEWIDGSWRSVETTHPHQPMHGFTISAEVADDDVKLLCQTWERSSAEGRRLTQLLAELSISRAEGVPTRRYVP
jgi:hypothetical protein